jgi:hypothetical protein
MAKQNKDDHIHFRIRPKLKQRYVAACDFRETNPTEDLTRHIAAFTREAEKEMSENGIVKALGE